MEKAIKILVIGNKDTNREEFINLMSSYGESENEDSIEINKEIFKFDDIDISSEQNFVGKLLKEQNDNIILLTVDYQKSNSYKELEDFYDKNKEKIENYFNVIAALNWDSYNKEVKENIVKSFAKKNNKKLFNFNLIKSINFERKFKSILTEYGKKYGKKTLIIEKEKEKLTKRCNNNNIYDCKIGFIGSKSGKTTLINCFKTGQFNPNIEQTTLMNQISKIITLKPKINTKFIPQENYEDSKKEQTIKEINEIKVNIELWDTPHVGINGENMNFVMMVAKKVDIIVYLFDNNNIDTLDDILNFWDKKISDNIIKETIFFIVENKTENKEEKEEKDIKEKRKNLYEDIDADGTFVTNAKEYTEVKNLIDEILIYYFSKIKVFKVEDIKKETENIEPKDNENKDKPNSTNNNSEKSNDKKENKKKKKCWIF